MLDFHGEGEADRIPGLDLRLIELEEADYPFAQDALAFGACSTSCCCSANLYLSAMIGGFIAGGIYGGAIKITAVRAGPFSIGWAPGPGGGLAHCEAIGTPRIS